MPLECMLIHIVLHSVNLGGWLVLEPFITPAFYEKYSGTVDEWTLSQAIAADPNSGGLQAVLENHYNTFIVSIVSNLRFSEIARILPLRSCFQTEEDFAQIAAAGLSWVRIPFPFWAIEIRNDEPFLERVQWK